MSIIQDNYLKIFEKIENACTKIGRAPGDVKLVVVTKEQSAENILEVINAGASILGENYLDETSKKIVEIDSHSDIQWHMIGHLQSRKIKYLFPNISMIQSIDSIDIANKIEKYCRENKFHMNGLIELNIAGEGTKTGFDVSTEDKMKANMDGFIKICSLEFVNVLGLMVMPPYSTFKEQNRVYFEKTRDMLELVNRNLTEKKLYELSMGTSLDFEIAIEAGSTFVRVGEAIMGIRPQRPLEER